MKLKLVPETVERGGGPPRGGEAARESTTKGNFQLLQQSMRICSILFKDEMNISNSNSHLGQPSERQGEGERQGDGEMQRDNQLQKENFNFYNKQWVKT